jgi:hypothetical protein
MNDIKLYIGKNEYLDSKLPWTPTLDSVLTTQQKVKNKYLYKTIIIFRKLTPDNYNYPMGFDMLYTNSNTDYLTQHLGTDGYISMNGGYDYFDGTYYYSYLVMYSNTINQWNVINDDTVYAVLYDQLSVTLNGGVRYIMNEHRITKNVNELIVTGGNITNIETLILPNKTSNDTNFETYMLVTSCKKYRLFDEVNLVEGQQVNTLNGLLYTVDYSMLLAVPFNFELDLNNDFVLPNYTTSINEKAFSISDDDKYNKVINILRGDYLEDILDKSLFGIDFKTLYCSRLKYIGFGALENSKINQLYLPNTLVKIEDNSTQGCNDLERVYLQSNIAGIIDLRGANNIDAKILSLQLYNVADLTGLPTSYIYLTANVYDLCTAESIKHCEDLNWTVVRL